MLGCLLSFAQSSICSVNPSFSQKQNGAESNLSSIFFVCDEQQYHDFTD